MSACRSCGAPILWVFTEKGKKMPLDTQPIGITESPGQFVLRPAKDWGYPADEKVAMAVAPDVFPNEPHYTSHFATCPNANDHRRSR